jgi:hypothetical protein
MMPYLLDINADYRSRCGRCGAEQIAAGGLPIESPSIVQAHKPDGERPVFFADERHSLVLAVRMFIQEAVAGTFLLPPC